MLNEKNVQRSIVISKELDEKIKKEAEEKYVSTNWVIRKIIKDYYNGNYKNEKI